VAGRASLLDLRLSVTPGAARDLHRRQDDAAARRHRGHRRAAASSAGDRRRGRHGRSAERWSLRPRTRRGYQPYEFERFGLDLEHGRQRFDEAVDIIVKSFEGKPFSYDGKLFKIPETSVFPRATQRPRPPIWITAQSPESIEWAVRRRFNVLTGGFGVSVERLAEFRKLFDRVVAEVKPAEPVRVGVQRAVYVAENMADAREAAEQARWNMRVTLSLRSHTERVENGNAIPVPGPNEASIDDLLERFLVIGTPDTVIRQVKRLQDESASRTSTAASGSATWSRRACCARCSASRRR